MIVEIPLPASTDNRTEHFDCEECRLERPASALRRVVRVDAPGGGHVPRDPRAHGAAVAVVQQDVEPLGLAGLDAQGLDPDRVARHLDMGRIHGPARMHQLRIVEPSGVIEHMVAVREVVAHLMFEGVRLFKILDADQHHETGRRIGPDAAIHR